MNRIERLIWEKTLMNGMERLQRESRRASGAKVVSIVLVLGMMGLLAIRAPAPPADGSMVQRPVAVLNRANDNEPAPLAQSREAAAAARAARQDDTPIPTF